VVEGESSRRAHGTTVFGGYRHGCGGRLENEAGTGIKGRRTEVWREQSSTVIRTNTHRIARSPSVSAPTRSAM